MPRRRFELVAGKSAKFWEISQTGKRTTVRFGRLGTEGQTKIKESASAAAAKADAEKLISQKQKKGYVEVVTGNKSRTTSARPAKRAGKSAATVRSQQTPAAGVIDSATAIPKKTLSFISTNTFSPPTTKSRR